MQYSNGNMEYHLSYDGKILYDITKDILPTFEIIISQDSTKAFIEFRNGTIIKDVPVTFGN